MKRYRNLNNSFQICSNPNTHLTIGTCLLTIRSILTSSISSLTSNSRACQFKAMLIVQNTRSLPSSITARGLGRQRTFGHCTNLKSLTCTAKTSDLCRLPPCRILNKPKNPKAGTTKSTVTTLKCPKCHNSNPGTKLQARTLLLIQRPRATTALRLRNPTYSTRRCTRSQRSAMLATAMTLGSRTSKRSWSGTAAREKTWRRSGKSFKRLSR